MPSILSIVTILNLAGIHMYTYGAILTDLANKTKGELFW